MKCKLCEEEPATRHWLYRDDEKQTYISDDYCDSCFLVHYHELVQPVKQEVEKKVKVRTLDTYLGPNSIL